MSKELFTVSFAPQIIGEHSQTLEVSLLDGRFHIPLEVRAFSREFAPK